MNNRTLTSANAILLISVQQLYASPQRIQGFSSDDITDTDTVTPGQTSMGIDGRLSAGFVPAKVRQNITLQADSLSNDIFEHWFEAQKSQREMFVASGVIIIPSTQRRYTMVRGFLMGVPPTPALRAVVQPRRYSIEWENVSPAPYII